MDIDQKIRNLVSQNLSCSFPILKTFPPTKLFYKTKKPLPCPKNPSKANKSFPTLHQKPKPDFFLTQISTKINLNQPTALKIFGICLKSQNDRKKDELGIVADWIQEISFLYPLSAQKLALLAKNFFSKYFRKGEFLFNDGEKSDSVFFILSGHVELFENRIKCGTRQGREIVGENSFVEDISKLSAKASTEVYCLCIRTEKLLKILEKEPAFIYIHITIILKNFLLFSPFPFLKLFSFSKRFSPIALQKPSFTIYKPGDASLSFYILISGEVKEKLSSFSHYEDIKQIPEKSTFGTREYLLRIPRRSLAQGTSSSQIFEFPDTQIKSFLKKARFDLSKQENIFEVPELSSQTMNNLKEDLNDSILVNSILESS